MCEQILERLCVGLDHTTTRNSTTDGSHALVRPDATYGQPPIVFFEEKAEGGALKQAERELHQNLQTYLSIFAYSMSLVLRLLATKPVFRQLAQ